MGSTSGARLLHEIYELGVDFGVSSQDGQLAAVIGIQVNREDSSASPVGSECAGGFDQKGARGNIPEFRGVGDCGDEAAPRDVGQLQGGCAEVTESRSLHNLADPGRNTLVVSAVEADTCKFAYLFLACSDGPAVELGLASFDGGEHHVGRGIENHADNRLPPAHGCNADGKQEYAVCIVGCAVDGVDDPPDRLIARGHLFEHASAGSLFGNEAVVGAAFFDVVHRDLLTLKVSLRHDVRTVLEGRFYRIDLFDGPAAGQLCRHDGGFQHPVEIYLFQYHRSP